MSADATPMRACSVLFLFGSLAAAPGSQLDEQRRSQIEGQILRLLGDLAGTEKVTGFILLAKGEAELRAQAKERRVDMSLVERVCREGSVTGAVPLYVRGSVAGVIAAELPAEMLAAVATLAAAALESVRQIENLQVRNAPLEEQVKVETCILGESVAIQRLLQMVERLASQDTTVLVLGESGTGKELVARALHARSRRRDFPFVAINCAALTPELLESELFGHEKGAFTDASEQKKGKLERADGGTMFLDEVGELAPEVQAKLLRVLQERELERVGGTKTLRLDVRLIAATNRDLRAEVRRGELENAIEHAVVLGASDHILPEDRPESVLEIAGAPDLAGTYQASVADAKRGACGAPGSKQTVITRPRPSGWGCIRARCYDWSGGSGCAMC